VFLGAPSALCGSRDCSQGMIRFTCDTLLARLLLAISGPNPSRTTGSFGSLADISGKVCQGLHYPKGYSRFVRLTMSSLSQALPLDSELTPQTVNCLKINGKRCKGDMRTSTGSFFLSPSYTYCISRRNCFGDKKLWVL
jgi:hypothetical protein